MHFLRSTEGQDAVEWLTVVAIVVTIVGGVIWSISDELAAKLQEYANAL